jgi:hypothetical protein
MALPAHVSERRDTGICPDASSGNRCNASASFSDEATILVYVREEVRDYPSRLPSLPQRARGGGEGDSLTIDTTPLKRAGKPYAPSLR